MFTEALDHLFSLTFLPPLSLGAHVLTTLTYLFPFPILSLAQGFKVMASWGAEV